jgi:hypothetical protein
VKEKGLMMVLQMAWRMMKAHAMHGLALTIMMAR